MLLKNKEDKAWRDRLLEAGLALFKLESTDVLFVLGAQKYNQNTLVTLLNFLDLT